jgi:hypothetical protein
MSSLTVRAELVEALQANITETLRQTQCERDLL